METNSICFSRMRVGMWIPSLALLRYYGVVLCGDQTMKASRMMVSVSDAVVQGK